ncbi:hypothetical protein [Sulfuricurvum sp.]|nr:hypothetical protein [Sulfuricurvum sp.]MDD2781655.1 hypothetical protein [Sulfuricurvum sp.]
MKIVIAALDKSGGYVSIVELVINNNYRSNLLNNPVGRIYNKNLFGNN